MLKKSIAFICALTLLFSQASIINAVAADKTAPKILSATPKNSQTGVSVTQTISLKFSENIYKGTYFTKIKLTRAGVTVSINRSISKNVIKITHATKLKSGTNYVLTIPAKAVKDSSKNQFTKTVTIKFKTKVETTRTKLSVTEVAKLQSGVVYIELYNKDGNAFASASGFIVDDKVITNCHVIDRASSAEITLADGSYYDVTGIYSYDSMLDLAVLKTNALSLPSLKLGDSSSVVLGEQVVAIGSPLGMTNTVSTGIISAIRYDALQISVPISYGSSGGALFNMYGEVVGITSSGYDEIGEINFAIPINDVKTMLQSTTLKTFDQVRAEIYNYMEEVELNNTSVTANNLVKERVAVGILSEKEDQDYYKITISTAGEYSFYSTIGGDGWYCDSYSVILQDSSLNNLATASVYQDKDSMTYLNQIEDYHLEPGTYYILVKPNLDDYYYSIQNMEYLLVYGNA